MVLLNRCGWVTTSTILLIPTLLLMGCTPSSPSAISASPVSSPSGGEVPAAGLYTPSVSSPSAPSPPSSPSLPLTGSAEKITVRVYKADDQCVKFVPDLVDLPGDRSLEAAVGEVLKSQQNAGDFDLSGYRVSVDRSTGVATVDLRMAPTSKRQIVSLAACEQFSLFGALRKTLIDNPEWGIKDVQFTERGKEIVL